MQDGVPRPYAGARAVQLNRLTTLMRWWECRRRNALFIVSMAVATVSSVSASGMPVADSRADSLPRPTTVSVFFLDATGRPSPSKSIPRELTIHLGAMPGRFGGVGDVPLQTIQVGRNVAFPLDLSDLSAKLSASAARSDESDTAPIELTPKDVRFSRVSTSAFAGTDPLRGLAVVFWDLEANGSLVPVFF